MGAEETGMTTIHGADTFSSGYTIAVSRNIIGAEINRDDSAVRNVTSYWTGR